MSAQVTILGAGESGEGAAKLCHSLGMSCRVTDAGAVDPQRKARLAALGADIEEGGHDRHALTSSALVVKSPGIPPSAPPVQWAREAGIDVMGELEFAAQHTTGRIAAVTGTNGKTTTTALLHHLPVGEHGDLVRVADRRQPVRDHERRALPPAQQLIERLLHDTL